MVRSEMWFPDVIFVVIDRVQTAESQYHPDRFQGPMVFRIGIATYFFGNGTHPGAADHADGHEERMPRKRMTKGPGGLDRHIITNTARIEQIEEPDHIGLVLFLRYDGGGGLFGRQ